MKRVVVFFIFMSAMSPVQACSLCDLFHLLTCGFFKSSLSDAYLLQSIQHKLCYERGVDKLLKPIYDFLVYKRRCNPNIPYAVVFDLDGVIFYANSRERINGVYDFYSNIKALGFSVIFLSSRPQSERVLTEKDLRDADFYGWRCLELMPDDKRAAIDACGLAAGVDITAIWKAHQRVMLERSLGVQIIATLDDNPAYLVGDSCGMPVWIPGYLALRKHYYEIMSCNAQYVLQHN